MVALVEAAKQDDHIGLLGFFNGFGNELVGRAQLVERATYGDTVVALDGVAHITSGEVDLTILEAIANAVEGQDFLLNLQ